MEASQHSLLAACFTLHSINATLAIVPQRGAGLWICGYLGNAINAHRISVRKTLAKLACERIIFRWILRRQILTNGGGWNCLQIVTNGGLSY
jgi:hypothetical protein